MQLLAINIICTLFISNKYLNKNLNSIARSGMVYCSFIYNQHIKGKMRKGKHEKSNYSHVWVVLWRFSCPQAPDSMDRRTQDQVVIKSTDHSPAPGLRLTEIVHAIKHFNFHWFMFSSQEQL